MLSMPADKKNGVSERCGWKLTGNCARNVNPLTEKISYFAVIMIFLLTLAHQWLDSVCFNSNISLASFSAFYFNINY